MTATLNRRARERNSREELILDTAAAMLLKDGYLGLNLDHLAEKVEYAKGTLYLHFESKEDLILAIASRNLKQRAHLFEHAVLTSASEKVGEVEGVPVYLQPAMVPLYSAAEVTIDVIEEPISDALSLETEYGLRFVLREKLGDPTR